MLEMLLRKYSCLVGVHRFQDCWFLEENKVKCVCVFCGEEFSKDFITEEELMKVQNEKWMPYSS